ncbi:hypothetical protein [Nocardia fluminea]|uniref:hypothetical protein n=1 Tax=Nocardia fluminea TaxID=134984 RepID=UPI003D09C095
MNSQQEERYGVNQDTSVELLWELLRLHEYPDAPSRLQSVFAWKDLEDARQFAGSPQQGTIWQIETEQPGFRADMSLVRAVRRTRDTLQLARMYWAQYDNYDRSGLPSQCGPPVWEYLLTPPVRVVRAVVPST